ncbi:MULTISPECIES: hypothetical protein [Paenibacillus]|uniref:Uncharacterized protein n=1 Tax=Paenibacillus lignilyticus TaxID=1172615 RepID=A0ABS5CKU4_9BACL|nr:MULTISPECIES: hypothetical protein [Paenibacillus]MBP3966477.1 hypothetical protein [Paenibacillus lignilyticus]SFT28175.1 hypothetical protein SAMN05428962_6304 [Paenibacillus sp. BC26]
MSQMLNKLCVKTFNNTNVITEIGVVKKVNSRTIHVDWGKKVWVYQNREFRWVPVTEEEFLQKYGKNKFSPEALVRAEELGLNIQKG